jgi:hypothetical protein
MKPRLTSTVTGSSCPPIATTTIRRSIPVPVTSLKTASTRTAPAVTRHTPSLRAHVRAAVVFLAPATRITNLTIERVPVGAKVRVACRVGHGSCPVEQRIIKVRRATRALTLSRMFRRASLRQGTIVEITITKPQTLGVFTRLTMRNGRLPRRIDSCLNPRNGKRVAC